MLDKARPASGAVRSNWAADAPEVLTGSALFVVLFAMQFLLGAGQGPTFPVSTGVFETWFPARHWALVQGLQTMGLGLGGALAPPFIAALMTTIGWQKALWWTALPAIPLFLWWGWYGLVPGARSLPFIKRR